MKHWILDAHGEPVETDWLTWARWFEHTDNRILARDRDESGLRDILVSTIFLGLDHNFCGGGAPVLWETMVLRKGRDLFCERYTSRAAALQGHQRACQLANAGAFDDRLVEPQ